MSQNKPTLFSLEELSRRACAKPLPILSGSLKRLRRIADAPNFTHALFAEAILYDPGLTLAILLEANKRSHSDQVIATVSHAASMLGIGNVLELVEKLPSTAGLKTAWVREGFGLTVSRMQHAARQLKDWSGIRAELRGEEVYIAALLHDLGELITWLYQPSQARQLHQTEDPLRLSEELEEQVLGFNLMQLSRRYGSQSGLPSAITASMAPFNTGEPGHTGVTLAVLLVKEAQRGWKSEQTQAFTALLSSHLGLPVGRLNARLHEVAISAARQAHRLGLPVEVEELVQTVEAVRAAPPRDVPTAKPAARATESSLGSPPVIRKKPEPEVRAATPTEPKAMPPDPQPAPAEPQPSQGPLPRQTTPASKAAEEIAPPPPVAPPPGPPAPVQPQEAASPYPDLVTLATTLTALAKGDGNIDSQIRTAINGMRGGLGMGRVLFGVLAPKQKLLQLRYNDGLTLDPTLKGLQLELGKGDLFSRLMEKPQALWLNDGNRKKIWPMVPAEARKLTDIHHFFAMSIFVGSRPFGLFYIDNPADNRQLNQASFDYFKKICQALRTGLKMQVESQARARKRA